MAGGINRLSARFVATVKGEERTRFYPDGAGLYLQVTSSGAKSWVFRYRVDGRERYMGLGSASVFGLQEARERATAARRQRADGIDPLNKDAPQIAVQRTWGDAVKDYVDTHKVGFKRDAQSNQWLQSLEDHGLPFDMAVRDVDTAAVVTALRRTWTTKTETATRVRGRIERIWNAERVAGHAAGENPARWKGHLQALLPPPEKVRKRGHFAAMPYKDVPQFFRSLGGSTTAKGLRFTILTVSRTGEVIGMNMGEVKGDVWTVPKERMKAGREHRVPLTDAALSLLPRTGQPFPLSDMAMLNLLKNPPPRGKGKPYTVHGFRSSFRDWAAEQTDTPSEVVEMALAHVIGNKTEAAYRRGDLLEKRRVLMQAWADYVCG